MTLLMNAIQAIEDKGTITIQTSADADCVRIDISDSGKGISPEKLETIFDFSFTTKDNRIGMSMNLSNAYNTMQSHRGQLQVDSRIGEGTTFTIILPINLNKK
jgi:signal transduction histidine kinase